MAVEWLDEERSDESSPPALPPLADHRRAIGAGVALTAAVAAAAAGYGAGRATAPRAAPASARASASPAAERIDFGGTVIIRHAYHARQADGDSYSCTGIDADADVAGGAPVRILDGQRRLLATTALDPGHPGNDGCLLRFHVSVPAGATTYVVTIADRPGIDVAAGAVTNLQLLID